MTISLAWIRKNKNTRELVFASDSRLRSRGSMDQAQKIYKLSRGDSCLSFCGDTAIAYPLFIQISSTLDNHIRTRTRAKDITDLVDTISEIINNIVTCWDLSPSEKNEELTDTKILFGGWSWKFGRFELGLFKFENENFSFHRIKPLLPHPWKENEKSLVFIGDYQDAYMKELGDLLAERYGEKLTNENKYFDFDYEPIEALNRLLTKHAEYHAIGGGPQMIKVYPHSNSLPIVVRPNVTDYLLLGRKLFSWEKTEYPILDISNEKPIFLYPLSYIPLPADLGQVEDENE